MGLNSDKQAHPEISDNVGMTGPRSVGVSAEFTPSYTVLQQAPKTT